MSLIPPQKFILLDENFARGAYPSPSSMRWVKSKGFRNFVYIGMGFPGRVEARTAKESGLSFIHIPIPILNNPGGIYFDDDSIAAAYKKVNHELKEGKRVFLFDDDGFSATGIMTALFRRDQGWSPINILEEFEWLSQNATDQLILSSIRLQIYNLVTD
jgi:single-stranded DNA-specific DHH superfamily exonuclease